MNGSEWLIQDQIHDLTIASLSLDMGSSPIFSFVPKMKFCQVACAELGEPEWALGA